MPGDCSAAVPAAHWRAMLRTVLSIVIPALLIAAGVLVLAERYPDVLAERSNRVGLTASLLWIVLLGGSVALQFRHRPRAALGALAAWVAIGAGLLLAYTYSHEAETLGRRMLAELMPSRGLGAGGSMVYYADRNGQFSVEASVEGVPVRFLVDTGATDVVLSLVDAERVGIDRASLRFVQPYRTANGIVLGASVQLDSIRVGEITMEGVAASVNPTPMSQSLLGMSFLSRLSSYEITRDTLTLRR